MTRCCSNYRIQLILVSFLGFLMSKIRSKAMRSKIAQSHALQSYNKSESMKVRRKQKRQKKTNKRKNQKKQRRSHGMSFKSAKGSLKYLDEPFADVIDFLNSLCVSKKILKRCTNVAQENVSNPSEVLCANILPNSLQNISDWTLARSASFILPSAAGLRHANI